MPETQSIKLFRASENDPLALPDKATYGDQYALYQMADRLKPKHSLGRLGSIFAGLTKDEAKQWGDKIWNMEAEVPYKGANAYDIQKWSRLVEFYLLYASKNNPETYAKIEQLIKEYWDSQKSIKEILDEIEENPEAQARYEVLLKPEWVTKIEEIEENQEIKREFGLSRR